MCLAGAYNFPLYQKSTVSGCQTGTLYFPLRKQGAEIVPILLSMQVSGGATNGPALAQRLNPLRIIETKVLHIKMTASTTPPEL